MSGVKENFIRTETDLRSVPAVPDIHLYVADESTPLWQKTEQYLGKDGMPPPFWAFAWPGGQALARYLLDHPETVEGRSVLDFACGGGLAGIAAMKAGAQKVLACDIDPFAIAAAELNAKANNVALETLCADIIGLDGGWDVILVGDICYERDTAQKVITWLEKRHQSGSTIFIGDPERTYLPKERLKKIASYDIVTTKDLEDSEIKTTGIWCFQ